jgi:hypothetical protein
MKETERRTEKNYTQQMKQKGKATKCSSQLAIKYTERLTENRYTQIIIQKDKVTKCSSQ